MVHVGGFAVALVRADTKQAFQEHTAPNGRVYAEVEPGVDYLMRVTTPRGRLFVKPKVDSEELGYSLKFKNPSAGSYVGSRTRKDGISTTTALRFNLVSSSRAKSEGVATRPGDDSSSMLTGKVEVEFYELGSSFYAARRDYSATKLTGDASVGGKKCVLSAYGTSVLGTKVKPKGKPKKSYKRGAHVCTVRLHYCTATGLIVNNILGAPPAPEPAADEIHISNDWESEVAPLASGGKVKMETAKIECEKDGERGREEGVATDGEDEGIELVLQDEKKAKSANSATIDLTGD